MTSVTEDIEKLEPFCTASRKEKWYSSCELRCWRRLLRVPWTERRSNQSNLKDISPEYSLEGLMLKLKLQYFGHLTWRADSLEKTLMLGNIEGRRRRGCQKMRWLDGITDSIDMSLSSSGKWWRTGKPGVLQSTESQRVRHDWATEQQSDPLNSEIQCLYCVHIRSTAIQVWLIMVKSKI